MVFFCAALAAPAVAAPKPHSPPSSKAQTAPPAAPKELGRYKRWIAATHPEGGQTVCYAFTRVGSEDPATGNGPILTVTDRPGGRDEVAISGAPVFPKDYTVTFQIGQTGLDFYTAGRDAFARDNKATVAAMMKGSSASARVPGSKPGQITTLTFSLEGFTAAHDAIEKACPAR